MYDAGALSSETLQWVMGNALNELNAYLCEVDIRAISGSAWPQAAREQAMLCRAVASAATNPRAKEEWIDMAKLYEETITT